MAGPAVQGPAQPFTTRGEATKAFAHHLSQGKVDTFDALGVDLVLGRRDGPYFWDAYDDRRFFNCHCNGGVFNLGHHHPGVVAALRDALGHVDVGNHHLVSGWKAELATRLSSTTNERLPGVVLTPSGSEAVEVAIKTAIATTGRRQVVSADGSYHGHTGLAAMAADAKYHDPYGIALPGFVHVPWNDLGAMDAAIGDDTALVLLEAVPATLGMPLPRPGYLAAVQEWCRDRGAMFAVDEIQTGLGRSGRMWCHEHDGVEPDVVITGKGLGGGLYPMAATLMNASLHRFYDDNPFVHVSSYGGSDLGCIVALAALDIVEAPGFLECVDVVGERLEAELAPMVGEVRRRGLFMGLKWPGNDGGMLAAKACFDAGIFTVFANNDTSVLQFLPPLVLTDAQVDELCGLAVGRVGSDGRSRMSTTLDIERLEHAVQDALARNDEAALHVLGYGEISPVVAWPTPSGPWACKRLPIFDAPDRFEAYRSTFDDYLATLSARGVVVHDTALESVELPDGHIAAYCVQPALGASRFGPALLRDADEAAGQVLLASVIDHVADAVSADVGLDAQVSNWARHGDDLVYVDVTTPLLRDVDGRDRLDTEMFLASLPAALRPIVRRFFLQGILDPYYAWRSAALDLLANLYKEGLGKWVPSGIRAANERLGADLEVDEVRQHYRSEARLWGALQRMRRVDRSWQRVVRRRVPVPASWSDRPAHLIRVHSVSTARQERTSHILA